MPHESYVNLFNIRIDKKRYICQMSFYPDQVIVETK